MAGLSIRTAESIAKLTKTSGTTLSLAASRINVGALQYVTGALTLNTGTSGLGGMVDALAASTLYYVYAVVSSGTVYLVASTNSSLPTGYTQCRQVGVFSTDGSSQITSSTVTGSDTAPVGKIISFPSATIPPGWMICDGSAILQATYTDLYAVLGSTWNTTTNPLTGSAQSAPSSGYFRIPNLQGVFLRSVADYAGADAYNTANDVALGVYRVDQGESHTHSPTGGYAYLVSAGNPTTTPTTGPNGVRAESFQTSMGGASSRTGFETAPKQIGVYYIIKTMKL